MNIQGYGSGSFADIMNSSHKRNQIPLVNHIVSYRDTEDGEIYRAYFTDDKVTSHNAVGQKTWGTAIKDAFGDFVGAVNGVDKQRRSGFKDVLSLLEQGAFGKEKSAEDALLELSGKNIDADAYRESLHSGNHSAVRESDSSDNGRAIGVATVGNIGYLARYADSSTPDNPVIKIGDYEVLVNEVDPQNATQIEMFALLSYLDDTNQTNSTGMSSFSKLRSYADLAEMNGFCEGIKEVNSFYNKNQNWEEIMRAIKEVFLGNPQTYEQALNCEKLISAMEGTYEYY